MFLLTPLVVSWLIIAIFTTILVLARRLSASTRKRRLTHAMFIWAGSSLLLLVAAWQRGQFRDAVTCLPIILLGATLLVAPLFGLSWLVSTWILRRYKRKAGTVPSSAACATPDASGHFLTAMAIVCLLVVFTLPWWSTLRALEASRVANMQERNREMWIATTTANYNRDRLGLTPLWPADLGFTGTERSTAFFRQLLSDTTGVFPADPADSLVPDLSLRHLSGPGLRTASSAQVFGPENNAWQVVCIGRDAPPSAPFLISRNVDVGDTLTPTSQVRFIRSGPLKIRRVVWLTRGGGNFNAPIKGFAATRFFGGGHGDLDPAVTSAVYRVMRP